MNPRRIIKHLLSGFNGRIDSECLREFRRGAFIRLEEGAKEHSGRSMLDIPLPEMALQEYQDAYNYIKGQQLLSDDFIWIELERLSEIAGTLIIQKIKEQENGCKDN